MLTFHVLAIRKAASTQTMARTFYGIFYRRDGGSFYHLFFRNALECLCKILGLHRRGILGFSRDKNALAKLFFGRQRTKRAGILHRAFRELDERKSDIGMHNCAHLFCPAIQSKFPLGAFGGILPSVHRSCLQFGMAFRRSIFAKIFFGTHKNREHRDGPLAFALCVEFDFRRGERLKPPRVLLKPLRMFRSASFMKPFTNAPLREFFTSKNK